MDKLVDYVKWIGDLSFDAYPFREADALVLCVISYFDLGPVFVREASPEGEPDGPAVPDAPFYVRDCIPMLEAGEAKIEITGGDMGNTEIFEAAARSRRFGDLIMRDYVDILKTEPSPVQFSAVTFDCPERFSFVAFRGTDASLAGWKEDFMIAFTETDAQRMARDYAEEKILGSGVPSGPDWYIGGHSKGGNQALYAACTISDEAWDKVTRAYLLDGPGFCPEVMDLSLIDRIDPKTTRIIPEFDVIGKLFEPKITDTKIVLSYREGPLQHSLASWLVDHGSLALTDRTDPKAAWLNTTVDRWISTISQEDRPVFIGELFDALGADGIESVDDMTLDALQSALVSLRTKSDITKQALADLPKAVPLPEILDPSEKKDLKTAGEAIRKFNLINWLETSRFAHAVMLIAGGMFFLLLNENIAQISSFLIFFSLTFVQCGLTIRRLIRNQWSLEGMRERIILSIVLLGVLLCLLIKEQAMFLLGSMVFAVLCFVAAYICGEKVVRGTDGIFMKTLHAAESVISAVYGIGFLLIPAATSYAYALSIGVLLILDGIIRLIRERFQPKHLD